MGLTTALNTSLNGLTLNETAIEVLGNNIANAGTNCFKASTVQFATQLSRTLSVGSAPTGSIVGTNRVRLGSEQQLTRFSETSRKGQSPPAPARQTLPSKATDSLC